jgi:hypothetical protein
MADDVAVEHDTTRLGRPRHKGFAAIVHKRRAFGMQTFSAITKLGQGAERGVAIREQVRRRDFPAPQHRSAAGLGPLPAVCELSPWFASDFRKVDVRSLIVKRIRSL